MTAATTMVFGSPGIAEKGHAEDIQVKNPPKIYKWIDQNGISHYTTDIARIPKVLRHQLKNGGFPKEPTKDTEETKAGLSKKMRIGERGFSQNARLKTPKEDSSDSGKVYVDQERITALDTEILALEESITSDEEVLKSLVSREKGDNLNDPEQVSILRELGDRLPQALKQIEALRAERGAINAE